MVCSSYFCDVRTLFPLDFLLRSSLGVDVDLLGARRAFDLTLQHLHVIVSAFVTI